MIRAKNLAHPDPRLGLQGGEPDAFSYPSTPYFSDVPATHPQFQWIQKMSELGYTAGCGYDVNGQLMYCPDVTITRGQAAVLLTRGALGEQPSYISGSGYYFSDLPWYDPYWKYAQSIYQDGIDCGCAANQFCPNDPVNRGQAATLVMRRFFGMAPLCR
jgi:hypothetical protein